MPALYVAYSATTRTAPNSSIVTGWVVISHRAEPVNTADVRDMISQIMEAEPTIQGVVPLWWKAIPFA